MLRTQPTASIKWMDKTLINFKSLSPLSPLGKCFGTSHHLRIVVVLWMGVCVGGGTPGWKEVWTLERNDSTLSIDPYIHYSGRGKATGSARASHHCSTNHRMQGGKEGHLLN